MLGQRVFRSMRVSSTELGRLAQASNSSIPKPNSHFPWNAVLSKGRCPDKEAFAVCGFLPSRVWAQASSCCCTFRRVIGLERTALHCCFLVRLPSRQGRRTGEKCCLLDHAFQGSMFASCVHPARLNKQTQPQRCSSVRSLGWHSMHTTIPQCRHRLAFYSGAQADSWTRPVLSPTGKER